MTRVRIAPPDTEEDVSAEQMAASDAAGRQNKPIRNNRRGREEKERRPLARR